MEYVSRIYSLLLSGKEDPYPDTLTVSGNGGPAGEKHPRCLGVFKKIETRKGGVPVWKNGHGMFFYYSKYI